MSSRRYNYLRIAVSSLAKVTDRIIVPGHEESLQYLTGGNIHQVIGGSVSKRSPTKLSKEKITTIGGSLNYEGKFTHGKKGFSKPTCFNDGSSEATFITAPDNEISFAVLSKSDNKVVDTEFAKATVKFKKKRRVKR